MLGLSRNDSTIAHRMITTSDVLTGFEITAMLGTVEGVAEIGFTALSLSHASVEGGGKLDELVYSAKEQLARAAFGIGANAVIGFRFEVVGRHLEKSVLAYGTAVKCSKVNP